MKNLLILIILTCTAGFLMQGCEKEKIESKSMEDIRRDEGIPVKVQTIELVNFKKELTFYAKLSGIKEAIKNSIISGKIERINATVGSQLKENDVVVEFDTYNPGAQYQQAKTAYENAEKTYLRLQKLLEIGETAQASYDGAEAQYLVSKRNFESIKQMLFIEAPFTGTLVDLKVNEGDNVKGDVHLFTMAVLSKMRAKIWASESEISLMKKGMQASMLWGDKKYNGKIVEISMVQDPYKQAFYAEVEFDNSALELKSGVTVEIKVMVYSNPNAIIIPRNLVKKDNKGMFVFVESDGIAQKRYVTNGIDSGLDYEISSGISAGDKIIVQGASYLDEGSKVKVLL